ncbi:MAG: DUF1320 domain-containing protein [Candidatus Contendobacter sp.]
MSYTTRAELEAAFGVAEIRQLTDRNKDGEPDSEFIDSAIQRTDGLIDGYLMARYALPLVPVPLMLTAYACDIARYFLYEDAAPEYVRQTYQDALRWLRDVASGKVLLTLAPANGPLAAGSPQANAPERVFTAARLTGF